MRTLLVCWLALASQLAAAQTRTFTPDDAPRPAEATILNARVVAVDVAGRTLTVRGTDVKADGGRDEKLAVAEAGIDKLSTLKRGMEVLLTLRGTTIVDIKVSVKSGGEAGRPTTVAPVGAGRSRRQGGTRATGSSNAPRARATPGTVVVAPGTTGTVIIAPGTPGATVITLPPAPTTGGPTPAPTAQPLVSPEPLVSPATTITGAPGAAPVTGTVGPAFIGATPAPPAGTPFPTPRPVGAPPAVGTPRPVGTPPPVVLPGAPSPAPVLIPTAPPTPTPTPEPSPTPTPTPMP